MVTSVPVQGVQMGKSPNGVEMERPDRGLLADQDHQRAIWTSRARRFTSMAMVVDFLTAILALVAGGIINRWGLTALRLHPANTTCAAARCEDRLLINTAGWRNAAGWLCGNRSMRQCTKAASVSHAMAHWILPRQVLIRSMASTCSSAMIGYGLEAFVDMVASILVRACCPVASTCAVALVLISPPVVQHVQ